MANERALANAMPGDIRLEMQLAINGPLLASFSRSSELALHKHYCFAFRKRFTAVLRNCRPHRQHDGDTSQDRNQSVGNGEIHQLRRNRSTQHTSSAIASTDAAASSHRVYVGMIMHTQRSAHSDTLAHNGNISHKIAFVTLATRYLYANFSHKNAYLEALRSDA